MYIHAYARNFVQRCFFNFIRSLLMFCYRKAHDLKHSMHLRCIQHMHSALARLKRSGYLSVEPRPVANHEQYLPSTCILCVLWTLLVPLSGSRESRDSVGRGGGRGISGRPLNTEMSLPRALRTGRTRSSGRAQDQGRLQAERDGKNKREHRNGRAREW